MSPEGSGAGPGGFPPAPFLAEQARAPDAAAAVWLTAADGHRLRGGVLGHGPRGTILLLQGRCEYLEKYGPAAGAFAAEGYGTVSVDFRGQGWSGRLSPHDPLLGHIDDFDDYQTDLDALVAFAAAAGMPRPWHLLAHSMGGAVGLRALRRGLDVASAVFSAPMWGIALPRTLHAVALGLGVAARATGQQARLAPLTPRVNYLRVTDDADNFLTRDPDMLAFLRGHIDAEPALDLGGPTIGWVRLALAECRALQRGPLPDIPALVVVGGAEEVVSLGAIRAMVARWPSARLVEVPGARHEILMEAPSLRREFVARSAAFFASSAAG